MDQNIIVIALIIAAIALIVFHKAVKSVFALVTGLLLVVIVAGVVLYNMGFYFDKDKLSISNGDTSFTLPEGINTRAIKDGVEAYEFVSTMDEEKLYEAIVEKYPEAKLLKEEKTIVIPISGKTISISLYDAGKFLVQHRYYYKVDFK